MMNSTTSEKPVQPDLHHLELVHGQPVVVVVREVHQPRSPVRPSPAGGAIWDQHDPEAVRSLERVSGAFLRVYRPRRPAGGRERASGPVRDRRGRTGPWLPSLQNLTGQAAMHAWQLTQLSSITWTTGVKCLTGINPLVGPMVEYRQRLGFPASAVWQSGGSAGRADEVGQSRRMNDYLVPYGIAGRKVPPSPTRNTLQSEAFSDLRRVGHPASRQTPLRITFSRTPSAFACLRARGAGHTS